MPSLEIKKRESAADMWMDGWIDGWVGCLLFFLVDSRFLSFFLFFLFSLSDYVLVYEVEKPRYRQREEESKEEIEATGGIKLVNSNQKKSRGRRKKRRMREASKQHDAHQQHTGGIKQSSERRQLGATGHYTLHTTH